MRNEVLHLFTVIMEGVPYLFYDDGIVRIKRGPESYYDYYWQVIENELIIIDNMNHKTVVPRKYTLAFFERYNKYITFVVERDLLRS